MNTHYTNYYLRQQGTGISDIGPLYQAPRFSQSGRGGVGSFFSGIWKYLRPLVSSGVNALSSQAVKTGASILDQVGQKPLKEVFKKQGKVAMRELAIRGADKIKRKMQGGEGRRRKYIKRTPRAKAAHSNLKRKQSGKGFKRGRKTKARSKKKQKSKRMSRKSKRFFDIFNN